MKKLILVLPIASAVATDQSWQDFENNVYMGGFYSNNSASITQFGASSNNSGAVYLGTSALFDNKTYLNLEGNSNFHSNENFVGNWYNIGIKAGYSLEDELFNFIPYAILGAGNEGAYYSSATNINYGVGLLSELMITPDWLLYADINYQLQNYSNSINSDFNKNVLNNYTTYSMIGTPVTYAVDIGVKYITRGGYYFNPFFKYQNFQQTYGVTGGTINYGNLIPSVNEYQFGLSFGLLI